MAVQNYLCHNLRSSPEGTAAGIVEFGFGNSSPKPSSASLGYWKEICSNYTRQVLGSPTLCFVGKILSVSLAQSREL